MSADGEYKIMIFIPEFSCAIVKLQNHLGNAGTNTVDKAGFAVTNL
jgi:hypothetical protein